MRKRDLELLKNIKKQEQKKRAEDVVQQIQQEQDLQAVSFDIWWMDFAKNNIKHEVKMVSNGFKRYTYINFITFKEGILESIFPSDIKKEKKKII
jgi:hypothetical protein